MIEFKNHVFLYFVIPICYSNYIYLFIYLFIIYIYLIINYLLFILFVIFFKIIQTAKFLFVLATSTSM